MKGKTRIALVKAVAYAGALSVSAAALASGGHSSAPAAEPIIDLAKEAQSVGHGAPVEHGRKAPAAGHVGAHWGYEGRVGPAYWGELSEKYILCRIGRNQSPVNIVDKKGVGTVGLPPLEAIYKPAQLNLTNNGHTIQVDYPVDYGLLKVGGHPYKLLQFHFHTPSEHQKDGFHYPMEMHLVHKDDAGDLAVIGILFKEGRFNPELEKIVSHLPRRIGEPQRYKDVSINLARFFPQNRLFYQYSGSLTTPPCSEGVYWMVFRQPIEAAPEQIEAMQKVMGHNARPAQPLNSRHVLKSWADTGAEDIFYAY